MLFPLVGDVDDILAFGTDRKGLCLGFVQSALPPRGKVVDGVGESLGFKVFGADIKDRDLRARLAMEGV